MSRRDRAVALLLIAIVATVAAGRLGSADAGAQLAVAELAVHQTALSVDYRPNTLWAAGENGRFYQGNDVGNVILMLPAALAGRLAGRPFTPGAVPDRGVQAMASATVSLLVCLGLFALFLTLRRWFGRERPALALTLVFLFATMFGAYQKTGYEVVGATVCTCVALALLARALARERPTLGDAVALGAIVGVAALFRSSFAPFLASGVLGALVFAGGRSSLRLMPAFAAVVGLVAIPTLYYNAIRSGNPLLPLNAAVPTDDLGRPFWSGLEYNLVSVRKGLLFAAPIFVLLPLVLAGPWRRRLTSEPTGRAVLALLLPSVVYVCFIAKVNVPEVAAWGPRYLLPITPVLFLALCPVLLAGWRARRARPFVVVLLAVAVAVGSAPILTAWNDDLVEYREPLGATSIYSTAAHRAVLAGIRDGLTGSPRYDGTFVARDGVAATDGQVFPDVWWRRVFDESAAGGLAAALLLGALWFAARRALRPPPGARAP